MLGVTLRRCQPLYQLFRQPNSMLMQLQSRHTGTLCNMLPGGILIQRQTCVSVNLNALQHLARSVKGR